MTYDPDDNPDERFHFEICSGPKEALKATKPSISYCENHNADFDYGLAALDFKLAALVLIERQRKDRHLSNWTAPVLHMIRQTLELTLKSLIETIGWRVGAKFQTVKFKHDLRDLWKQGRDWLIENGYPIDNDARLAATDRIIENMHAIDPTGDLFRFGTSRQRAFGRNKSSDRVGYQQDQLFAEFEQASEFLDHWCGVVMREIIQAEQGWEKDPFFDREDYPKKEEE
jgi:hypothetical protein